MPLSGKTARIMGLAIAALVVGVIGGMLLAHRAPLWPTPRRPLRGIWHGHWRQSASGGLERFFASLECIDLPGHRLKRAALVTPDSMQCRYEPTEGESGDVVLVELVHSPRHAAALLHAAYPGRVSTREEQVALADGMSAGQRSTARSTSATTPGLDGLAVRGKHVTVEVTCLDFGGGVDVARCHVNQAAYFSTWKGDLSNEESPH